MKKMIVSIVAIGAILTVAINALVMIKDED